MRQVHVITPGDHFSPSTGSAIPTVVDGLCRYRPDGVPRPAVAVAKGTYPDRYDSADIIEYCQASPMRLPRPLSERRLDGALSLVGLPRWCARRTFAPTVGAQSGWEPSVVLAHNAPQLVPLVDTRKHAAVLYAHNHLLRTYSSLEARRVLGSAAAIICVSEWLAAQIVERLPGNMDGLMKVVRNGVDLRLFHPSVPRSRSEQLEVLFVGRMVPQKGPHVLVEAIARLGRADIHLILIGSSGFDSRSVPTEYEKRTWAAARELIGGAEIKRFVPRAEVSAAMARADVVVVPSTGPESYPLTTLEGMAAGAAVIASAIGGTPEAVGGVGALVPPSDSTALAGAIEALADDEALLQRTAHAGREFARAHDWGWASANLAAVLDEVG